MRRVLEDTCFSNPDRPWYRPQATRTDPLKPALITIFVKEEVSAKTILTAEQEDKELGRIATLLVICTNVDI